MFVDLNIMFMDLVHKPEHLPLLRDAENFLESRHPCHRFQDAVLQHRHHARLDRQVAYLIFGNGARKDHALDIGAHAQQLVYPDSPFIADALAYRASFRGYILRLYLVRLARDRGRKRDERRLHPFRVFRRKRAGEGALLAHAPDLLHQPVRVGHDAYHVRDEDAIENKAGAARDIVALNAGASK